MNGLSQSEFRRLLGKLHHAENHMRKHGNLEAAHAYHNVQDWISDMVRGQVFPPPLEVDPPKFDYVEPPEVFTPGLLWRFLDKITRRR